MAGKFKKGKPKKNNSRQAPGTDQQHSFTNKEPFSFIILCLVLLAAPFCLGQHAPAYLYTVTASLGVAVTIYLIPGLLKSEMLTYNAMDFVVAAFTFAYLVSIPAALDSRMAIDGFLYAAAGFFAYWLACRHSCDIRRSNITTSILIAAAASLSLLLFSYRTEFLHLSDFLAKNAYSLATYRNVTAAYFSALAVLGIGLYLELENIFLRSAASAAAALLLVSAVTDPSKGTALALAAGMVVLVIGVPRSRRFETLFSLLYLAVPGITAGQRVAQAIAFKQPVPGWTALLVAVVLGALLPVIWMVLSQLMKRKGTRARIAISGIVILALLGAAGSVIWPYITSISKSTETGTPIIIQKIQQALNTGDVSYTSRADFYRDALQIIADYPLLGTGAGGWELIYHKYQDYLYWSAQVHSFPLQVGVETGSVGLLALAFLVVVLLRYGWEILGKNSNPGLAGNTSPLDWGIFTALLMMLGHSLIDFDMSAPFFQLLFFALLGMLAARDRPGKSFSLNRSGRWTAVSLAALAVIVVSISLSYYAAIRQTDKGSALLKSGYVADGLVCLQKAASLDSGNSMYHVNLARVYAAQAAAGGTSSSYYYQQALSEARTAERLSPYRLETLFSLMKIYLDLGDQASLERITEKTLSLNPWDVNQYANLLKIYTDGAYRDAARKRMDEVRAHLAKALSIPKRLEEQKARIPSDKTALWRGSPLQLNAAMEFDLARAHYLRGDYDTVLNLLDECRKEGNNSSDVQVLYAASLARSGRTGEANQIIQALTKTNPELSKTYQYLIGLPVVKGK